jgi:small subunit ribosomal protein S15
MVVVLQKDKKTEVISNHKVHAKDTGSAPVQIALLSEKINYLTEHLQTYRKDFNSRRGLLMMIGKRRRLLAYLKESDSKKYEETIKKLNLRK